jgi:hypothetical protein
MRGVRNVRIIPFDIGRNKDELTVCSATTGCDLVGE